MYFNPNYPCHTRDNRCGYCHACYRSRIFPESVLLAAE